MPQVTDLTDHISRLREKKSWNHHNTGPDAKPIRSTLKLRPSLFSYFTYGLLAFAIASQLVLLVYFSLD